MAHTVRLTLRGEPIEISVDSDKELSVSEGKAIEALYGAPIGTWGRAYVQRDTDAVIAAAVVYLRRSRPDVEKEDLDNDSVSLSTLYEIIRSDKPSAKSDDDDGEGEGGEKEDPTPAA